MRVSVAVAVVVVVAVVVWGGGLPHLDAMLGASTSSGMIASTGTIVNTVHMFFWKSVLSLSSPLIHLASSVDKSPLI